MSHGCGNPSCPTHGDSPQAKALRQAKQELVSSEETMNFIRILAGNVHQSILETAYAQGQPELPTDQSMLRSVLTGNYDSDPVVQGILKGLTVALAGGHEPTKVFATSCSEVREEPFLVERLAKAAEERDGARQPGVQRKFIPGLGEIFSFQSPEDLLAFLKGR